MMTGAAYGSGALRPKGRQQPQAIAPVAMQGGALHRAHRRAAARARLAHWTYWPRLGPPGPIGGATRVAVWPNHVSGSKNPYQTMVYHGTSIEVVPFWHLRDALRLMRLGQTDLLHIHFDEGYAYQAAIAQDMAAAQAHIEMLRAYRAGGGRYAWTLHNTHPAVWSERAGFPMMRRFMAETADLIIVHTATAAAYLQDEFGVAPARIVHIEHPSFVGWTKVLEREEPAGMRRRFLHFGDIKPYKGVNRALAAFAAIARPERAEYIIAGQPDPGLELDLHLFPKAGVLRTSLERVAENDVPALFAAADFALLPYDTRLTSGVALMAMTHGVPVIAPGFGEMRESLPAELGPLLYDPDAPEEGLRLAIERACAMPQDAFEAIRRACREHADRISPGAQARKLVAALSSAGLLSDEARIATTPTGAV